jgi:ATP-dependent DNA helicase RecQ
MSIYSEALERYWGYSAFRPLQEEIIESVGSGKDTLALMPTGGGKSLTFQVPAMAKEGICLVVTPLIALMKDQVENLKVKKIKALAIHSGLSREEIGHALDNCIYGDFKFLYLSPERLSTDLFRARVQQMNVNLIAIDEAHCISQWGYDFRPSYMRIPELREIVPDVPVLALTATATPNVAEDIMQRLSFSKKNLLKMSFERKNLVYVVRRTEDKQRELLKIASKISGTGIVYVRNRKKTREVAELLNKEGIRADFYHAGLKYEDRARKQEEWQHDKTRVVVSTNAFGMGIDKPDVKFVVHMDIPDSPEAYFQEAGRAGRDEKKAWAVMLFSPSDEKSIERRISVNFPGLDVVRELYKGLFNYLQIPVGSGRGQSYDFILGEFLSMYKFNALVATSALKVLSREGYFEITEEINNPSRVFFTVGRDDLYKFQVKNSKFDGFIKLLLRSYTGLFSQYVAIDENILAKRSGLSFDQVYKYLISLASSKIINYIPKKKNPVIHLLEERLEDKNVYLSSKNYIFRKEKYITRINEMLAYAKSETKCRSQFLLSYFGDISAPRCGQCDICLSKNELNISKERFSEIEAKVKKILTEEPLGLLPLIRKIESNERQVILVVEQLMEDGYILREENMLLSWKKPDALF